jgi:para-aminobenzoate synthetase component 1
MQKSLPYSAQSKGLFELFAEEDYAIYLDSCSDLRAEQGKDFISARPEKVFFADQDGFRLVDASGGTLECGSNTIDQLLALEAEWKGQILGYFGYHCLDDSFQINSQKQHMVPTICFGFYSWHIEIDHAEKNSTLIYEEKAFPTDQALNEFLDSLANAYSTQKEIPHEPESCGELKSNFDFANYERAFNKVKNYIHEGDVYQVNLAQRFSCTFRGSAWEHYLNLRKRSPAPYACYFHTPFADVLSFSPESFLKMDSSGKVISQPIKGTRKRFTQVKEDQAQKLALQESEKDKAENLMIVDLIRNDLSKSAEINSVNVEKLFEIESFSNVHHMVSTVSAQKKLELSPLQVLMDCFPGGSITGAPKKRAMEIIDELEPDSREIYCGAIGYVNPKKEMEFNIAIRSILIVDETLYCWGGGGLVADSEVEAEYQESINKISNLIALDSAE